MYKSRIRSEDATECQEEIASEVCKIRSDRYRSTIDSVAEEYVCPITGELPLDPVIAEDGRIYERASMERLIRDRRDDLRSPVTEERMGPSLVPALQVRSAIERLILSGAVGGDKAARWIKQFEDRLEVEMLWEMAKDGDTDAMCRLAYYYGKGEKGLPESESQYYYWVKRAADAGNVRGMAQAGSCLVHGSGVKKDEMKGAVLLGMAAQGGSDGASYLLAKAYDKGLYGFEKDLGQAKLCFRIVATGKCTVRHLTNDAIAEAIERLKQLESEEKGRDLK